MAYNVYFACDVCGNEGLSWVNHMVAYSTCVMYARQSGWKVGKRGWICPSCQKKKRQTQWYYDTRRQGKRRGKVASKTPQGLANAMAEQWGGAEQ